MPQDGLGIDREHRPCRNGHVEDVRSAEPGACSAMDAKKVATVGAHPANLLHKEYLVSACRKEAQQCLCAWSSQVDVNFRSDDGHVAPQCLARATQHVGFSALHIKVKQGEAFTAPNGCKKFVERADTDHLALLPN